MSNTLNSLNLALNASGKGYNPYRAADGKFANGPSSVCAAPVTGRGAGKYIAMLGSGDGYKYIFKEDRPVVANCYKGRKDDEAMMDKLESERSGTTLAENLSKLYSASNDQLGYMHSYARLKHALDDKEVRAWNQKEKARIRKERAVKDKAVEACIKTLKNSKDKEVIDFVTAFEGRYKAQSATLDHLVDRYF